MPPVALSRSTNVARCVRKWDIPWYESSYWGIPIYGNPLWPASFGFPKMGYPTAPLSLWLPQTYQNSWEMMGKWWEIDVHRLTIVQICVCDTCVEKFWYVLIYVLIKSPYLGRSNMVQLCFFLQISLLEHPQTPIMTGSAIFPRSYSKLSAIVLKKGLFASLVDQKRDHRVGPFWR